MSGKGNKMADDPFIRDFDPPVGLAQKLVPGLRRIVAPNASAMTFTGTNTYVLGTGQLAVIDPGPDDDAHLSAILQTPNDNPRDISHIFVTHSHVDHSPLSRRLAKLTGAPVLAFGNSQAGRSPAMAKFAEGRTLGGGEGVDPDFQPDICLADGEAIKGQGWTLTTITTPGHFCNHLCFAWEEENAVFSGDHVMSCSTTMVSPPDGDLSAFMRSLDKMAVRTQDRTYYPGHGAPLADPHAMIAHQRTHRKMREKQILDQLSRGPRSIWQLTEAIYTEIPKALMPAASRNVLAHLLDLMGRDMVTTADIHDANAKFAQVDGGG